MLQPGEVLHTYTIVGPKGDGSYGFVFEASDSVLSESVALKVLSNPGGDNETRFRAENDHLHTLAAHVNIIDPKTRILDMNGRIFYCMELADTNTEDYLISNKLNNEDSLKLFKDIASGLKHAHDNGIVHRDLHLKNILLMTPSVNSVAPKLTDFGMAKDFNGVAISSIPANVWGAVAFRPPEIFFMLWEQAELEKYVLADIYALGMVLHNLLNPRPVAYITGLVDSITTFLYQKNTAVNSVTFQIDPNVDAPTRAQFYGEWLGGYDMTIQDRLNVVLTNPDPQLEKELNRIIQKCCSPDYNSRYTDVGELINDIEALC